MKKFLLMVIVVCALTSCSSNNANANGNSIPTPTILKFENDIGYGHYSYIVDKNTGVVYLEYDGCRRHALTVMLNADGTPVTAEQIGIKY